MSTPMNISSSISKPDALPRKTSKAQNAAMREILWPWGSVSSLPPGCRTVSYSSWSKFSSSSESSKSKEELLASILWAPNGTSPDYSPPVTEWCNLSTEEPIAKPIRKRKPLRRSSGSINSWPLTSTGGSTVSENKNGGISFTRVPIREVSTSSMLTMSFQSVPGAGLRERMSPSEALAREMKERMLGADMLPSAFDSDSEDEKDDNE